ncbi:MAG: phage tail protein [Oscillospiraceae bacterium]|nr:phage tail protein [Oscillospiraceae bacterium]
MLKIYDQYKNFVGHLEKYKDLKTVEEIGVPDSQMSFTLMDPSFQIRPEWYVVTEDAEYVVKETPYTTGTYPTITCVLNLEDWATPYEVIQVTQTTIAAAVAQILPAGWSIGSSTVTKERNAGMMHVTALEALQKLCTAFMCEMTIDTVGKTVSFAPTIGQDRGAYFMSGLNLKKLTAKRSSYDYYTRIIPIGKNGLNITSVNNGLNYLENYQYSDKILAYIWKNEDYDNAQALKDDAELYLDDLSKPEVSYSAEIRDLAAQSDTYSALDFALGDTITLVDLESGTREKQRIKKITRYPGSPEKNTCEIGNTMLTFEEMQDKVRQSSEIVNYMISGTGQYSGTITVSGILGFEAGVAATSVVTQMQTDITTAAQAAALAQTTADGKNQVLYATVPPVGSGLTENDIWFDTDDGNKMYRWTGSAWEAKQFDTAALAAECIDTAHLAASAVTAAKIATGTITADKINVSDLFAQNITATGTISGATLTGTTISADNGDIGGFTIKRNDTGCASKTTADGGHAYGTAFYKQMSDSTYEYEVGMKGDNSTTAAALYVKSILKGDTWNSAQFLYYVRNDGYLFATNARIAENLKCYYDSSTGTYVNVNAAGFVECRDSGASSYAEMNASSVSVVNKNDTSYGAFLENGQLGITASAGSATYSAVQLNLNNSTSGRTVRMTSSAAGNCGIYDPDNSDWIICSDSTFETYTPHPFRCYNSFDTTLRYPVLSSNQTNQGISWLGGTAASTLSIRGYWNSSTAATKTVAVSSSDVRLKDHITDSAVDALQVLDRIRLRSFSWREDGSYQPIGVIADELEEIDPRFVVGGGEDEDGNPIYKSINNLYLLSHCVRAIQQLKAEIEALKRGA